MIWLIGENNPYSADERHALFPYPPQSAGARLCFKILKMDRREYLRTFRRKNLLYERWSIVAARTRAAQHLEQYPDDKAILLGRKVYDAFAAHAELPPWKPFSRWGRLLALPHPSGLNRAWNEPGAFELARMCVADLQSSNTPNLLRDYQRKALGEFRAAARGVDLT